MSTKTITTLQSVTAADLNSAAQSIPLNPNAKATKEIKEHVAGVVREITKRRGTITAEQNRRKKEALLASYRQSVNYDALSQKLEKAEMAKREEGLKFTAAMEAIKVKFVASSEKLDDAINGTKGELLRLGLSPNGCLMEPVFVENNRRGQSGYCDPLLIGRSSGHWEVNGSKVTQAQVDRINQIKEVITAVGASAQTVTSTEALTMRLMMATTVGELIAIVNAVAGEDVFQMGLIPGTNILSISEE